MIKKFNIFCESISYHFEDSVELKNILKKYKIEDDTITDYFTELIDDAAEIRISSSIAGSKDKIIICYNINVDKKLGNPVSPNFTSSSEKYINFLSKQINFVNTFNSSIDRLRKGEDLEIRTNPCIYSFPFWKDNKMEYSTISISAIICHEIKTDEYGKAKEDYNSKDNPLKKSIRSVISTLKSFGVKEAEMLVDTVDSDGHWVIGFLTDDEIIAIGSWDEDNGLKYNKDDFKKAINYYQRGYCDEMIRQ